MRQTILIILAIILYNSGSSQSADNLNKPPVVSPGKTELPSDVYYLSLHGAISDAEIAAVRAAPRLAFRRGNRSRTIHRQRGLRIRRPDAERRSCGTSAPAIDAMAHRAILVEHLRPGKFVPRWRLRGLRLFPRLCKKANSNNHESDEQSVSVHRLPPEAFHKLLCTLRADPHPLRAWGWTRSLKSNLSHTT